jgi:hypothetical protein
MPCVGGHSIIQAVRLGSFIYSDIASAPVNVSAWIDEAGHCVGDRNGEESVTRSYSLRTSRTLALLNLAALPSSRQGCVQT